jgi:hypothetical protein
MITWGWLLYYGVGDYLTREAHSCLATEGCQKRRDGLFSHVLDVPKRGLFSVDKDVLQHILELF